MKKPPPVNQLHPEDFYQQFHNSHMFQEPAEGEEYPTVAGCVLRHGAHLAAGGAVKKPTQDPSSVLRALALSRSLMKGS